MTETEGRGKDTSFNIQSISQRERQSDVEKMASGILTAQSNLRSLQQRIQTVMSPYAQEFQKVAEQGDSREVRAAVGRAVRTMALGTGWVVSNMGLSIPSTLDISKWKTQYTVDWGDGVVIPRDRFGSDELRFSLSSALVFEKSWDPFKLLKTYTLDITQESSKNRFNLLWRLEQEKVKSIHLSWRTTNSLDFRRPDYLVVNRLTDPQRRNIHDVSPLGDFIDCYTRSPLKKGGSTPPKKLDIELKVTGAPEVIVQGRNPKEARDRFQRSEFEYVYFYNDEYDVLERKREGGEQEYRTSGGTSLKFSSDYFLLLLQGLGALIPANIPETHREQLTQSLKKM